jgi:hypothetical protein
MVGVPFPNDAKDGGVFFVGSIDSSELDFVVVAVVESSGPQLIQTMADLFPIITIDPTTPFPPNDDDSADGKASPIGIIEMTGSSRPRVSTGTTPAADATSAVVVDNDDIVIMALLYLALLNYDLRVLW